MKVFRNFLALLTAASIAFSLAACSKEEATTAPTETEVIFTEEETVTEPATQVVTEPYTQQETTQTVTQDSTAQATKPAETKPQAITRLQAGDFTLRIFKDQDNNYLSYYQDITN